MCLKPKVIAIFVLSVQLTLRGCSQIGGTKAKDVKEKVHKVKSKEELFYCKDCDYKCKKEIYLQKHMLSTHGDHTCNECKEKLTTFMELLKHVAKHHYKEGETEEKMSEGEAFGNIEDLNLIKNSDHKEKVTKEKDKGLGLKESKLGELV